MLKTFCSQWQDLLDEDVTSAMDTALLVVTAARAAKSNFGVPDRRVDRGVTVVAPHAREAERLRPLEDVVRVLARTSRVTFDTDAGEEARRRQVRVLLEEEEEERDAEEARISLEVFVDLLDLVDVEAEIEKRRKKLGKAAREVERLKRAGLRVGGGKSEIKEEAISALQKNMATYTREAEFLLRARNKC